MNLDLFPYSHEGLSGSGGGDEMDIEINDTSSSQPSEYYQYELVGVVVHTGTITAGKYFY